MTTVNPLVNLISLFFRILKYHLPRFTWAEMLLQNLN